MFELTHRGRVAVLQMTHGKANAMDLEFCAALNAQVHAMPAVAGARALVITGQGKMFSAGVDLPRLVDGGAAVRPRLPAGDEPRVRGAVRVSEAAGRRRQRPRDCRRLRDGVLRRLSDDGARARADRHP